VQLDDADLAFASHWKWSADVRPHGTVYAVRMETVQQHPRRQRKVYLHRQILSRKLGRPLGKQEMSDHENGDGLDCRRYNLRLATSAVNNRNTRSKGGTSQFKGVSWCSQEKAWQAVLDIGLFASEENAARARDEITRGIPGCRANFENSELELGPFTEMGLSQGQVAKVSPEDEHRFVPFRWYAIRPRNVWYAVRHEKRRTIYLHREVLAEALGRPLLGYEKVDHRNGDGLDCRRTNLRVASFGVNAHNTRRGWGRSKYRGVSWVQARGQWLARIRVGLYQTEEAAAAAYDSAARLLPGWRPNFPSWRPS